jgi:hypothetical protein
VSGIPAWAVRGAKVVCVNGKARSIWTKGGWAPQTDGVYTVERAFSDRGTGKVLLELREYVHDVPYHGWDITRFRPLVDDEAQERDVAIFRHHLTQKPTVDA